MSETESVSKGCFIFKPKIPSNKKKVILPDPLKIFTKQTWYEGFTKVWRDIEKRIEEIEDEVTETLLSDLTSFIASSVPSDRQIPTAAILTGVNLPDHGSLFSRLKQKLKKGGVVANVATLNSVDCASIKHTVEKTVAQLMSFQDEEEKQHLDESDSDEENETVEIKKSKCTLPLLVEWLKSQKEGKSRKSLTPNMKFVIILQDFETFPIHILQDFIQILSGYRDRLPLILVFGIATAISALSDNLTHKTMSRLDMKAFQSKPSIFFLNNTLNKVFLSPDCPFQLGRKLFQFFTNVFLFYDFSVNRFTQGLKYCVMEHFREGQQPIGLLCVKESELGKNVEKLNHADLDWIRHLESFKKYIESTGDKTDQNPLFNDDKYTKKEILKLMKNLRSAINEFYVGLQFLYILVSELPQAPFGKHFRELYCAALGRDITKSPEYKESRQLLGFLAKDQLLNKLDQLLAFLNENKSSNLSDAQEKLLKSREKIETVGLNTTTKSPLKSPRKSLNMNIKNRMELKQKVFEMGRQGKSDYEKLRDSVLDYMLYELLPTKLQNSTELPLWEVITVVETEARYRVVPRIRAPIHSALNNPACYLLCDCCKLKDGGDIFATMPDICIVYKLHLESGSLINMYDWLQSFNTIVNPGQNQDDDVDPKIQARFTQAVSELEFLGFIKSSKKKTDHVQRLTWGGSTGIK